MSNGVTPLFTACVRDKLAAARFLLDAGANPNFVNNPGSSDGGMMITAFMQMVLMDRPEAVQLLIKYGADIKAKHLVCKDKGTWITPLTAAAIMNSAGVGRVLLDAGADINAPESVGLTPLATAALNGQLDFVRVLLERNPDLKKKTSEGWTALTAAAYKGHLEVVKALIDHGAIGDPSPYRFWKWFHFHKEVPKDTRKAILKLVRRAKHSQKLNTA